MPKQSPPVLLQTLTILPLLLTLTLSAPSQSPSLSSLVSQTKVQKSHIDPSITPSSIYALSLDRISTNKQSQPAKCIAQQKEIRPIQSIEKFRVGKSGGNSNGEGDGEGQGSSVYETLTKLEDREDGIQGFKVLGEKILVLMGNGTVIFLDNRFEKDEGDKGPAKVESGLEMYIGKYKVNVYIAEIGGNAFLATVKQVVFCEHKLLKCTKIQGFKGVNGIANFYAYEYKGKKYLFFLTGDSLTTYQVSTNGMMFNQRIYRAQFFKRQKISITQMVQIAGDKILILDFYVGLYEISHSTNSMTDLKNLNGIAYQQFGCQHLAHSPQADYLTLKCTLTQKTYYILQLSRPSTTPSISTPAFIPYTPTQQPIFFSQILTGIDTNSQLLVAKIFSGVKIFWCSPSQQNPYPFDYEQAGSIFLHNAKGSQLWTLNNRKIIYIYTEDEVRMYQLGVNLPEIKCFSIVGIKQQYKATYTYLCDKEKFLHLKVCTQEKRLEYEAYEVKEVGIKTTILPLIVSSVLVVTVGILLFKLYKKYDDEIERTRLKYTENVQQFQIQN